MTEQDKLAVESEALNQTERQQLIDRASSLIEGRDQLGLPPDAYKARLHQDGELEGQIAEESFICKRDGAYLEVTHRHRWADREEDNLLVPQALDSYTIKAEIRGVALAQTLLDTQPAGTRMQTLLYANYDKGERTVRDDKSRETLGLVNDTVDMVTEELIKTAIREV
jgi:hypothetical protein